MALRDSSEGALGPQPPGEDQRTLPLCLTWGSAPHTRNPALFGNPGLRKFPLTKLISCVGQGTRCLAQNIYVNPPNPSH